MGKLKFEVSRYHYEGDAPWITCRAVSNSVVSDEVLDMLKDESVNQYICYRHVHMEAPAEAEPLGQVKEAWIEEKDDRRDLFLKAVLFNQTEFQRDAAEYIELKTKEKQPTGMSVGFWKNPKGDAHPIEYSITDIPVFQESEVIKMEDNEKRINELKAKLDEVKDRNDELLTKLEEKENGIEKLSQENKTLKVKFEKEMEGTKNSLKEQFEGLKQELENTWKGKIEELEKEALEAKRKPYIDQLMKYESERSDPHIKKYLYPQLKLEELEERIAFKAKTSSTGPNISISGANDLGPGAMEELEEQTENANKLLDNLFSEYTGGNK